MNEDNDKTLKHLTHLIALQYDNIDFLKAAKEYPFVYLKCSGSSKTTKELSLPSSNGLREKTFDFLKNEYLKEIESLRNEMKNILND